MRDSRSNQTEDRPVVYAEYPPEYWEAYEKGKQKPAVVTAEEPTRGVVVIPF